MRRISARSKRLLIAVAAAVLVTAAVFALLTMAAERSSARRFEKVDL